jgi:hypothetical protein
VQIEATNERKAHCLARLGGFHASRITLSKGFPDALHGGDLFCSPFHMPLCKLVIHLF